ncbi:hypothetical protein B0O80DRAFT_431124 [Mortierella sp. GBAus27b]|nr:hypothetical protein B0O80DRAFT_431124 [Mortierella sp. GBAus27b]
MQNTCSSCWARCGVLETTANTAKVSHLITPQVSHLTSSHLKLRTSRLTPQVKSHTSSCAPQVSLLKSSLTPQVAHLKSRSSSQVSHLKLRTSSLAPQLLTLQVSHPKSRTMADSQSQAGSYSCSYCSATFSAKRGVKFHEKQVHDNGMRSESLVCTYHGCEAAFETRRRFEEHFATHTETTQKDPKDGGNVDVDDNASASSGQSSQLQYFCSTCPQVFHDIEEFDIHLDSHGQVTIESPASDDISDAEKQALSNIRTELTGTIHNRDVADLVLEWTVPSICTHQSGEHSVALLTDSGAKRHADDPIVDIRPIQKKSKLAMELDDLKVAISGHYFGGIVDPEMYKPIDPSLYQESMSSKGDEIARTFAGALLQTGSSVILLIKVEAYGRRPSEDIHAIEIVKPVWDLYTVAVVTHDNTKKLIIGTLSFNILVTAAIDLVTGAISVGPDHYRRKKNSNIKAIATIFDDIGRTQCIKKALVESLLVDLDGKAVVPRVLRGLLKTFTPEMKERELKGDKVASRLLRVLADSSCGTIRSLNTDKIIPAIKSRTEALIQERRLRGFWTSSWSMELLSSCRVIQCLTMETGAGVDIFNVVHDGDWNPRPLDSVGGDRVLLKRTYLHKLVLEWASCYGSLSVCFGASAADFIL